MMDRLSWPWTLYLLAFAGAGILGFLWAIRLIDSVYPYPDPDHAVLSILQLIMLVMCVMAGAIVALIGSVGFAIGFAGNVADMLRRWRRWRNRKVDLVREVMES